MLRKITTNCVTIFVLVSFVSSISGEIDINNGIVVEKRLKIRGWHTLKTGESTCPAMASVDLDTCDALLSRDTSSYPEGATCLVENDNGSIQMFECVDGEWDIVYIRPGTNSEIARHKRDFGITLGIIFLFGVIVCAFLCRKNQPPTPTIKCPNVPKEFHAERGQRNKLIYWDRVYAYGDRPEIIRTQGYGPGTYFGAGYHTVTYMVKDRHGQTSSCGFNFNVRVHRCRDDMTYYFPNGNIKCSSENIFGSTCQYTCNYGYILKGSSVATCEKHGWTSSKPNCSAISCGQPPYIPNGQAVCGSLSYGSKCYLYCVKSGYFLQNANSIECQGNGHWTQPGNCVDLTSPSINCKHNMVVYSGPQNEPVRVDWEMPTASDNSDDPVIVTSNPVSGTVFTSGVHAVVFTGTDRNINENICIMTISVQVLRCSASQLAVDFSNISCSHGSIYGSQCSVNCQQDYYLEGDGNRTCQENKTWSGEQAICLGLPCPAPPEVQFGNFSCEHGYKYQEMCTLTCMEGFQPVGSSSITCYINWTEAGFCEDKTSPKFPNGCPLDMVVLASRLKHLTYVPFPLPPVTDNSGLYVNISSEPKPGSAFDIGLTNVTIKATDQTGNEVTCSFNVKVVERSCDPPKFDPVRKLLKYNCPDNYVFGASCSLSCPNGTELTETITCDERENGHLTWTYAGDTPPSCPDEYCPKLPSPKNGDVECEPIQSKKYGLGVTCRVNCKPGYGTPKAVKDSLTCYYSIGLWSNEMPNCLETKLPENVSVGYKMLYSVMNCSESKVQLLKTLTQNMKVSKANNVCLNSPRCPLSFGSSCTNDTQLRSHDDSILSKFEVSVVINLGQYNESSELIHFSDDILQETLSAIVIDDETGIYDLPGTGSPEEFTQPTLNYLCAPGTVYTSSSHSCVVCGQGYRYNNKSQSCVPCPQGTYQNLSIAFMCTKCPYDTTTKTTKATSVDDCIEICPPGTSSKTGLAPCILCDKGTYQYQWKGTSCDLCPFGMTTENLGSISSSQCEFYNIWLDQNKSQAISQLPVVTSGTFMMWVHLPVKSSRMALIFEINRDETDSAFLNIGPVKLLLKFEISAVIRSWYHVAQVIDDGNATLLVDGIEIGQLSLSEKTISSMSSSLSFTPSKTLKSIIITGVQMSSAVLTLEEIDNFSKSCHKLLDKNLLTVDKVDSFLITPSSCDDINECEEDTCGLHGYCVDGVGHFTCVCDMPWFGKFCEHVPDFCENNNCYEGSVCVTNPDLMKYTCQCGKGRKGTLCQEMAVNGSWGAWEPWGTCSTSCGEGQRSRFRACDNPVPDPEGENCVGVNKEDEPCNGTLCPVKYGQWGEWSNWTCSVTCGTGRTKRRRQCISLSDEDGGKCLGDAEDHKPCVLPECPVDGQFGIWSPWTQCSATCGGGTQSRNRKCDSPAPSLGGLTCNMTKATELIICNDQPCPVCLSLNVTNQKLDCFYNATSSMMFCNISCSAGFMLFPPEQNQVSCGLLTNYTWSLQNKDNPEGKLPQCSNSSPPKKQKIKVVRSYSCQTEKSILKELEKKDICKGNKHKCNARINSACSTKKRSTGSIFYIVNLELQFPENQSTLITNISAEGWTEYLKLSSEFEDAAVNLLNESNKKFSITVDGVQYNGHLESVQAEVICHEGSGYYNGLCVDCPAGSYSVGNGSCFQCQNGFYQEVPRMSSCFHCPTGLTTSGIGSIYKSECQENPLAYEKMFWWASDDEEIFRNFHSLNKETQNNNTENIVLNSDYLNVIIITCTTAVVISLITVIACIISRKTQQNVNFLEGKDSSMKNSCLQENIYTDVSKEFSYQQIYNITSENVISLDEMTKINEIPKQPEEQLLTEPLTIKGEAQQDLEMAVLQVVNKTFEE